MQCTLSAVFMSVSDHYVASYLLSNPDSRSHTSRIYNIPNMIKDMIEKVTFKMEFSSFFYLFEHESLCIVYIIVCE